MLWDNHQPYPQQADHLAKLLQKCRPYNHTQYLQHVQEQQVKLLTDFRARLLVTAQKYREKVNQEKLEAATFIQKNYAEGEARAL